MGPPEFREPLRRNTLKFNALMAAFGVTEVAYQYSFNNRAVLLDVQYLSTSSDGVKYSVLGLTPEYRIYFGANSAAPKGLYAGPYVSYYNIDGSGDVTTKSNKTVHVEVTGDALAAGAVLGYQYVADAGFTFDIFVARGFRSGNISVSASDPTQTVSINSPLTGEDLRLGACLGFTF